MPIFDFKCRACGHEFELLVRGGAQAECPACASQDVEKQFSTFKVGPPVPTPAQKEKAALERAGWVQVGQPFKRRR